MAAKGEAEPPAELIMVWHSRRWGVLPEAGGLLDQPAGLLARMAVAENYYNTIQEFDNLPAGGGADWLKTNGQKWQMVCEVMKWQTTNSGTS